MTPRRSVRAAAQRLYREMAEEGRPPSKSAPPTPDPSAPLAVLAGAGEGAVPREVPPSASQDLMAQVRSLYEDTAAPVREIARRAGVTERTLYKYARKHNWRPRYAWMPDGSRPPGQPGRRRWTQARARAAQFAPGQGGGGRFIRREEEGKPFAQGIKALNPAGRAAAAKASAEAERTARLAQAGAEAEVKHRQHLRAMDNVNLAVAEYLRFHRDRVARGAGPLDDALGRVHAGFIDTALRRWEWLVKRDTPPPFSPAGA